MFFSSRRSNTSNRAWSHLTVQIAFPQVYSVSCMLIEVKTLVLVFMPSVIGSLSGVLDIILELLKSIVLTTAIIMRVVTFLPKVIIGGVT